MKWGRPPTKQPEMLVGGVCCSWSVVENGWRLTAAVVGVDGEPGVCSWLVLRGVWWRSLFKVGRGSGELLLWEGEKMVRT